MKITIITVCLNRENTIEKTIQSVINQGYDGLEYVVIDGGSFDDTVDIIRRYERNLTYWISEKDQGIYDAMNKGIAKSTGEVIAFLNSDDWYKENTLAKVNSYFEKYNPMVLTGRVNTLQKGKWAKYIGALDCNKENIQMAMIYRQPAMFVRREVFERVGIFNTDYKIAADFEWMLRVYDAEIEIMCVEDVFTYFSSTGVSNTDTDRTIREARKIALDALEHGEKYSLQEKETWRRKIIRCYDEQQATVEVKKIIRNQQLTEYLELRFLMLEYFREPSYVVWGIGIIGEDMYNLLMQLGLEVDCFVDRKSSRIVQTFHDRKVIAPQELVRGRKVIIASLEYEDEIAVQLDEMGFHEKADYILYSSILSKLVETYMECYLGHEYRDYSVCVQ